MCVDDPCDNAVNRQQDMVDVPIVLAGYCLAIEDEARLCIGLEGCHQSFHVQTRRIKRLSIARRQQRDQRRIGRRSAGATSWSYARNTEQTD